MITRKAKYGIKALGALAKRYSTGGMTGIAQLAEEEHIPLKFLEVILLDLKNIGILKSQRGPGGGYALARHPKDITLAVVLRELDGPSAPVPCLSKTAYSRCDECPNEGTCTVRLVMRDLRDAIADVLEKTTIDDLTRKVEDARTGQGVSMYYI